MQKVRSERGFLSFSTIVALLVVAAVIFLALKLLPPYVSNFQLQDAVENIARRGGYSNATEKDIRDEVIARAGDFGIELDDRQVAVRKRDNSVDIAVEYAVQVDLVERKVELRFEPSAGNPEFAVPRR